MYEQLTTAVTEWLPLYHHHLPGVPRLSGFAHWADAIRAVPDHLPNIPNPGPDAPGAVKQKGGRGIALAKMGSLLAGAIMLSALGLLVIGAQKGGMGNRSAELLEKIGIPLIAIGTAMVAVPLVTFFR